MTRANLGQPADPAQRDRLAARLRAAGCVFAEREAALIEASFADPTEREDAVVRRCEGEPLEYVVGVAEFAGVTVEIGPPAFIPRARAADLVSAVDRALPRQPPGQSPQGGRVVALDLGCGCGAIAAALRQRHPDWDVHASDIDPAALLYAHCNAAAFGFSVHEGDWFDALPVDLVGRLDVIVAHLPYVPSSEVAHLPRDFRDAEPRATVDGGRDGLDPWRRVVTLCRQWLAANGILLTQVSRAQIDAAAAIARDSSLDVETIDLEDSAVLVVHVGRVG
ncbi:MAG: methyltransferase domain-containing protein [Sporichthyaceae bacterium]